MKAEKKVEKLVLMKAAVMAEHLETKKVGCSAECLGTMRAVMKVVN